MDKTRDFPGKAAILAEAADPKTKCVTLEWNTEDVIAIMASNRGYSIQFRKVISLATIDIRCAKEGTEVAVLYGSEGHRQMMARAIVTRTPYKADNRR